MTISIGLPFADLSPAHFRLAVQSVFAQTEDDWELLLLADGAPSALVELAQSVSDPRVRTLVQRERAGLAAGLNRIATEATGPLLARMDADDVMLPARLAHIGAYLHEHPEVDVVATRAALIDERGAVHGLLREPPTVPALDRAILRNPITHPTVVARTAWFRGHPYSSSWTRTEDKHLWQTAPASTRIVKLPEPLMAYRIPKAIDLGKVHRTRREDRRLLRTYGPEALGRAATRAAVTRSALGEIALVGAALARADERVYRRKVEPLPDQSGVVAALLDVCATSVPGW